MGGERGGEGGREGVLDGQLSSKTTRNHKQMMDLEGDVAGGREGAGLFLDGHR